MNHFISPNKNITKELVAQGQHREYILDCEQLEMLYYAFEKKIATYSKEELILLKENMLAYKEMMQNGHKSVVDTYLRLINLFLKRTGK